MTSETIHEIDIDRFICEPQVRKRLDPAKIDQMAVSFRAVGQLQPVRARKVGEFFDPVDGHYRVAAIRRAGLKTVAAIIEDKLLSEGEIIQRQLISNCQRDDLPVLDVARGVRALLNVTGWNASQVAANLGFSNAKVTRLLTMLLLPQPIIEQIEAGKITASGAYELARIDDVEKQTALASQMAEGRLTRDAAAGARKAAKRSVVDSAKRPNRVTAALGVDRTVTVSGVGLTLESFISLVEELLAKARRERTRGTELPTFIRILRDQAAAQQQ